MEKKPELSLEKLIELIKTPSFNRTSSDLLIMRNYFCQKIDYFKKLIQEPSGKDKVEKIISVLNYESFNKGEHIINFGDIGDKFYIVLSGIVGIYKPSPKNMDMTLKEYVDYLVRIRDWEKNMTKFERVQNYNSNIDKIKLLIINYNSSKLPYSTKKIPVIVEEERFIVKLGPGNSFGEMALIKNEPRNANIIAEEKCELVSIDKIDYRKIMKVLIKMSI
jgi:CRP-like cAMP-binding protein